jgi:parallel beta-helix repeat protein
MRRTTLAPGGVLTALAAVLVLTLPARSLATHAIVPDSHATIQAALNANTDTVFVADGIYEEFVIVTHDVVMMPRTPTSAYSSWGFPRVRYLTIGSGASSNLDVYVRGFYFLDVVNFVGTAMGVISFEACRFDSAITNASGTPLRVRGCMIHGGIAGNPYALDFTNNTVLGGGVDLAHEGYARVRYNHVEGPAAHGIRHHDNDGDCLITGNTVAGATDGIYLQEPRGADVTDNRVRDCTGTGLRVVLTQSGQSTADILRNDVRRVGSSGMVLGGQVNYVVEDNTVDSVGGFGIYGYTNVAGGWPRVRRNIVRASGSNGFYLLAPVRAMRDNRVLNTGGDGIVMTLADSVDHNVVGRSGLQGIRITGAYVGPVRLRNNTSYLNVRSGYQVTLTAADSVDHNIAYGNTQYGLDVLGTADPRLGCNDWRLNTAGMVNGAAPGATDFNVDPMFCDLPADNVYLSRSSSLLNYPGCGHVGALKSGCTAPAGVGDDPLGAALEAYPRPARRDVAFAFAPSEAPMRLEVFDLAGARRWSRVVTAGARTLEWDGRSADGERLPAGVYFARLSRGLRTETARVVLVR